MNQYDVRRWTLTLSELTQQIARQERLLEFAQQENNVAQMEQCADELWRLRASKADTERRLRGE